MELLDRRGDRSGALKVYGEWQARLLEDYGVEPAPETRKLANRVRAARKGESHETPPTMLKPVQVLPVTGPASTPSPVARPASRRRLTTTAAAAGLLLVAVATAMLWPDAPWSPRAGPHSVSVLPLRAIGSTQLQQHADALTEEMTTALAAVDGVLLRSATRAGAMLGDGADVDQLGRRLGVAFVADGSVQGNETRLRLTIRLLRADDAVAVWANTFDFMPEDLSRVAHSVADSVAAVLLRAGSGVATGKIGV